MSEKDKAADFSSMDATIESVLNASELLNPQHIEIENQSHLHAGHAGAGQGGHFSLIIVSEAFANQSRINRHRMVYDALSEYMLNGIHALNIKAQTPDEFF